MLIESSDKEILIRIPKSLNFKLIDELIEYLRVLDILSKSKGKATDAELLSKSIDKKWWKENKSRFIK